MSRNPIEFSGPSAASALGAATDSAPAQADRNADLHEVAKQLEGLFLQQLFQAMRAAAPEGTTATARTSDEFFGGMMDEHLAQVATSKASNSLGEALYRQLVGLTQTPATATPANESGEGQK